MESGQINKREQNNTFKRSRSRAFPACLSTSTYPYGPHVNSVGLSLLFAAPSGADDKNAEVSANTVLGYFFALFPLSYL
jgi:hypothetical protein